MTLKVDFQPPRRSTTLSHRRRRSGRRVLTMVAGLVVCLFVGILLIQSGVNTDLEARVEPVVTTPPAPPQPVKQEIKKLVESGETVTALLGDYFSAAEILELNEQSKEVFPFTRICAGRPYCITTLDGEFASFVYEIDDEEQLLLRKDGDQTVLETVPIVYEIKPELVRGVIKTSLFDAVAESGEQPELAYVLADIFGWDINFILDLRVGDSFQALVEKRFREGEPAGYGHVIAAEFINQSTAYRAIRYQDGDNRPAFYNEKGENLQKAFLKAPLSFTRISSGYTMRRLHPIKKVWRAHPAIDYAAPIGTPVKAVGDGRVTRKGYGEGNGYYVQLQHSNGYTSMYMHLKGFARGIAKGVKVHQGQLLGYVGSTGLSTGPHLDFRMTHHGKPINPLKMKAPAAKSVSKQNLADFQALAAPLIARLEDRDGVQVARAVPEQQEKVAEPSQ